MTSSQYSMAEVKLGTKSFSVDSEEIVASNSHVSDADCVAFCARLRSGDFKRLRVLNLVSVFLLFLLVFGLRVFCCCEESGRLTCAVQGYNRIGDEGCKALGEALKVGADVTTLLARVPGKPNELFGLDCGKQSQANSYAIPLPVTETASGTCR